ncbi:MAG: ferritin-like domain-containing protein [Myxococcales bacterium]|nr:ferritin-like domain-containing protein [Myxococcales bacterium]
MDDLVVIVRTTCLLESRSERYGAYLERVLPGRFGPFVRRWAQEEGGHGRRLRAWLAVHDPDFDFHEAFRRFSTLPYHHDRAADRAPADELLSRCVVEALAAGFYRALGRATDDSDLRALCRQLMADESRHFTGFLRALNSFEPLPWSRRLAVAAQRVRELDDDQIIFASHCAVGGTTYDRDRARADYLRRVYRMYAPDDLAFVGTLIARAMGRPVPPVARPALGRALAAVLQTKQRLLPRGDGPEPLWAHLRADLWALLPGRGRARAPAG